MKHIALIGAGQLGSRHLQALALLEQPATFYVVDPAQESLDITRSRFFEVKGAERHQETIRFCQTFQELPRQLDLVVVATGSRIRRHVIEALLAHAEVPYLLLEKILFSKPEDYAAVGELLTQKGVTAWVNCPRRMIAYYQELKERLKNEPRLSLTVTGSNWGLACNGIHFVDLFAYLTGDEAVTLSGAQLDGHILESKRAGYLELTGTLLGSTANGSTLAVTSLPDGTAGLGLSITAGGQRYHLDEGKRLTYFATAAQQWQWEQETWGWLFQSQLTNVAAQQILTSGTCDLTPYAASAGQHLALLAAFMPVIQLSSPQPLSECLIT
ncbi:MAG: Gfo/Idh/MocA family oxidoreductase [Hymenobacteraceae bacterium]|nr:Gfo/Idh/MocA family oxidoreductase [Hymenobacteraceae bacterium]